MPEKIVIQPEKSIPRAAAKWICDNLADKGNPAFFPDALAIVPTKNAGRHLREAVLRELRGRGAAGMAGLDISTIEAFVAKLSGGGKTAPLPRRIAAWIKALSKKNGPSALFVNGRPPRQSSLETAKELEKLRGILSEKPMSFAEVKDFVSARANPDPYETSIWSELAQLESEYLADLKQAGLECKYDALRRAVENAKSKYAKIAVIATPDAPAFLRRLAKSLEPASKIYIVPISGAKNPEAFDDIGRPLSDFFDDLPLDISPANATVFADARTEAECAARTVLKYGKKAANLIGISCEQKRCAEIFKSEFQKLGIKADTPEPRKYSDGILGKLVASIASYEEFETFSKFEAILQNPLFLAHLAKRFGTRETALLTLFDTWRERFAPNSAGALAANLADCGETAGAEMAACALETARGLCLGNPLETASILREMLGDFSLANPEFEEAKFEAEAFEALEKCAGELSEAAESGAEFLPAETLSMLAESLDAPRAQPPDLGGAIALQNWLEIFWSPLPRLLLCDINHGVIPLAESPNQFITDALKRELGIKNADQRRARDAHMLGALIASRGAGAQILLPQRDASEAPIAPSRILMASDNLPERVKFLFAETPSDSDESTAPCVLPLAARERLPADFSMSAYKFNSYLNSPIDFYIRYVLGARDIEPEKTELDAAQFGTALHEAMRLFALSSLRDSGDEAQIADALARHLDAYRRRNFGGELSAQLRIQFITLRRKLAAIARIQAERAKAGWRVWGKPERRFEIEINSMRVAGVIDRIDYNPGENKYAIIDFKTNDKTGGDIARKSHCKDSAEGGEPQWINVQLPLYALAMRKEFGGAPFECSLITSPQDTSSTSISTWQITPGEIESARKKMSEIIGELRSPMFPENIVPKYPICKGTFAMSAKTLSSLIVNG